MEHFAVYEVSNLLWSFVTLELVQLGATWPYFGAPRIPDILLRCATRLLERRLPAQLERLREQARAVNYMTENTET